MRLIYNDTQPHPTDYSIFKMADISSVNIFSYLARYHGTTLRLTASICEVGLLLYLSLKTHEVCISSVYHESIIRL